MFKSALEVLSKFLWNKTSANTSQVTTQEDTLTIKAGTWLKKKDEYIFNDFDYLTMLYQTDGGNNARVYRRVYIRLDNDVDNLAAIWRSHMEMRAIDIFNGSFSLGHTSANNFNSGMYEVLEDDELIKKLECFLVEDENRRQRDMIERKQRDKDAFKSCLKAAIDSACATRGDMYDLNANNIDAPAETLEADDKKNGEDVEKS